MLFRSVSKIYPGDVYAVKDVNLEVADKEFVVLVGPSGCGKSTTLRMIAGLEEITSGEILIDHQIINAVPAKNRDIAMVFQNYALYPHMSVYENLAFGLKLRRYPNREIERRVLEAAEILGIGSAAMLKRKPKELSGGERQRVAVGRAIVRKPKVFLFDEPLSNLDAKMRVQMRMELQKLHNRLQCTMIYVTHDQIEALTLGDRIVVMRGGKIFQISDPINIYENPNCKFVAGFIGSPPMNFLTGTIVAQNRNFFFQDRGSSCAFCPNTTRRSAPTGINRWCSASARKTFMTRFSPRTPGPNLRLPRRWTWSSRWDPRSIFISTRETIHSSRACRIRTRQP